MKKLALALAGLLALPVTAAAQGAGTNPPVGSVWTYLGPTYGAGWVVGPWLQQWNLGNFVQDPSPQSYFTIDISKVMVGGVMGSMATPDTTTNYPAVFQHIGTQQTSGSVGGAIYGSLVATSTADSAHGTAVVGEAWSNVSYTGSAPPFIEGVRGQCNLIPGGKGTQCNGMSGEVNYWTTPSFAFGIEGADNNNTGSPAPAVFDPSHFDAAFLASCGDHGSVPGAASCLTAYMVNPNAFPMIPFHYGFYLPYRSANGNVIDTAAFRSDVPSQIGIDLEGTNSSYLIKSASGFNVFGTGVITTGLGTTAPATNAAIQFYEAGQPAGTWDQDIQGIGGTGANGSGYLAMNTGGVRILGGWLEIGTGPPTVTLNPGEIGMIKTPAVNAPGAGYLKIFAVPGTTGGTCKLQAMAGTGATPVTIVDNVGAGC